MQELWKLFWIFFRIGAFTFGGGYVMIPIIQHEISEKHKLIDEADLSEILVIAQSLPGMMADFYRNRFCCYAFSLCFQLFIRRLRNLRLSGF